MIANKFVLLFIIPIVLSFQDITRDGCGQSKGCLRTNICKNNNCPFIATWKLVSLNNADYVEFELKGDLKSRDGYVSLGFSEDKMTKDSGWGDDGVVGCFYSSEHGKVLVRAAYNDISSQETAFIQEDNNSGNEEGKNFIVTDEDNLGGKIDSQNVLQCRFRRLVTPGSNVRKLKDLAQPNEYYLVVTRGASMAGNGFGKSIAGGSSVSTDPATITSPAYGSMTGYPGKGTSMAKAHGSMMIIAWVFCVSISIILARYYKDMWSNSGLLKEVVWFQAHRILNAIAVTLVILSVIIIASYCGGYSSVTSYPNYIHPILGFIVLVLTIINPFIALCRCHPGHEKRPYFNWTHFLVGTFAYVLSVPTMMLGFRMPAAGVQLASLDYPLWLLIFWVIFQFCVEIALEIHGCIYYKRNKNKRREFDLAIDQYRQNVRLQGGGHVSRPLQPEPSGRTFKYFMIGLHATVCAIITVILVISIAVN